MLSIKDDNFNLGAKVRQKCCSKKKLMLRLGEEGGGIEILKHLQNKNEATFRMPRSKCFHNGILLIVIRFNLYGTMLQLFL